MQSKNNLSQDQNSAEDSFRAAFERLKNNQPEKMGKGTPVSQNNVAREAGCDPSALRKKRYPKLISEIQYWLRSNTSINTPSPRQKILQTREHNRSLKQRLADMKSQRDHANSLLVEANSKILDLTKEIEILRIMIESKNVIKIQKKKPPATP